MGKVVDITKQSIEKTITEMGYELVDVTYCKQYDSMALTVFIDSDSGISLDDCEKVHRAIDAILDDIDPTEGNAYTLNVSSPGLDRPLVTDRDYAKKIDCEIEISLYSAINKKKKFSGILKEFNSESITIDIDNNLMTIDRKAIANAKPVIKF